ncbi:MAG: ParB/RepB/Spo0J family partition protein [Oscillospiraceae bacterium]|nr:ParB/RepB/Spo0J family partition protein [Ruminococcus sp.]MBQ7013336.1 ParB/RepB/Spo0J family partition protein [Oscillospiraceae bacterium]
MAIGGLGSGMDLLFEENVTEVQVKKTLRVSEIEPNRSQPRKNFDESAIAALADSIREHGVLQPILVRPLTLGGYQIVAGERRWRAARMLGLDEVPVVIRDLSDLETAQIALIENLQRENLNPVEEAEGYVRLQEEFGMKQEDIARTVGKSRSAVTNAIRLLRLPDEVRTLLEEGSITAGHARALLAFSNDELMIQTALKAAEGLLTVRAIEKMAADLEKTPSEKAERTVDSYFREMEISLHDRLGRKVKVDFRQNKGVLVLEFYDKEDLQALAEKLVSEESM